MTEDGRLSVMSYNIRFQQHDAMLAGGRLHPWAERREDVVALIRSRDPDILGLQEAQPVQAEYLRERLADHDTYACEFAPESLDQTFAIMWKRDRFMESGGGSVRVEAEWPHNRRALTWVKLRSKRSGLELHVLNTHFPPSRTEEQKVVLCEFVSGAVNKLAGPQGMAILTGDLNVRKEDSAGIGILRDRAGLYDPWTDTGAPATYVWQGWAAAPRERSTVDWVLFRRPFRAVGAEWLTEGTGAGSPSDHPPLHVVVEVPAAAPHTTRRRRRPPP